MTYTKGDNMKKVIRISTYVIFSLGFGILGYISFNNGDVESNKTKQKMLIKFPYTLLGVKKKEV